MGEYFGSGSRGLLTLDALISLMILTTIILLIPRFNQNLDLAIAYKEASDISQAIVISNNIDNPRMERLILERTNLNLQMKGEYEGKTTIIKWNSPENMFIIVRPVFDKMMEEAKFIFGY